MTAASAAPAGQARRRRPAIGPRRPGSSPSRRSTAQPEGEEDHRRLPSRWKFDSGWPPKNCSATTAASPATGSGPGARITRSVSSSSQGSSAQTFGLRPGDPDERSRGRSAKTSPASSAPPKRMPERAAEQEGPEGRGEHLEQRDHAERPPERQHVGGQAEGRQHRRLGVGEDTGARRRSWGFQSGASGSRLARVLEPGLELDGRVDQLVVRAEGAHVRGPLGGPRGGGPEVVGRRQRVPGQQRRGVEDQPEHGVDERGRRAGLRAAKSAHALSTAPARAQEGVERHGRQHHQRQLGRVAEADRAVGQQRGHSDRDQRRRSGQRRAAAAQEHDPVDGERQQQHVHGHAQPRAPTARAALGHLRTAPTAPRCAAARAPATSGSALRRGRARSGCPASPLARLSCHRLVAAPGEGGRRTPPRCRCGSP